MKKDKREIPRWRQREDFATQAQEHRGFDYYHHELGRGKDSEGQRACRYIHFELLVSETGRENIYDIETTELVVWQP